MAELMKVLVVDDEPVLAQVVGRVFEATGQYEVRVVTDAREAVSAALEFRPDVVILDVVMPFMDGGEVLAAIRKEEPFTDIPAVFLTGIVSESEIGPGAMSGGVPLVAKPVDAAHIRAVVAEVLQGR